MDRKEKICAVVVTYNRKQLLIECLESLLKQTHSLDAVYIIDNASTDGTPQNLKEKGYIKEILNPVNEPLETENIINMDSKGKQDKKVRILYVRMHKNTGGAGGFHEGVKRGYEKGYDWLWLMDDDVEPLANAIETMLNYRSISMCIHPRKKYFDGSYYLWEQHIDIMDGNDFSYNDISFKYGKKWTTVNTGYFEGMLIHRRCIDKIGYPDARFFIKGDDTIYGFLASLYTNVIYINEVCMINKIKGDIRFLCRQQRSKLSDVALYYSMRNRFLVEKYAKHIFPEMRVTHKRFIVTILLRKIIGVLIFDRHKIKRITIIVKGFLDGVRSQRNLEIKIPNFYINQYDNPAGIEHE